MASHTDQSTTDLQNASSNSFYTITSLAETPRQALGDLQDVPIGYLSEDEQLFVFVEFRLAMWIDYIYAPLCAGVFADTNIPFSD